MLSVTPPTASEKASEARAGRPRAAVSAACSAAPPRPSGRPHHRASERLVDFLAATAPKLAARRRLGPRCLREANRAHASPMARHPAPPPQPAWDSSARRPACGLPPTSMGSAASCSSPSAAPAHRCTHRRQGPPGTEVEVPWPTSRTRRTSSPTLAAVTRRHRGAGLYVLLARRRSRLVRRGGKVLRMAARSHPMSRATEGRPRPRSPLRSRAWPSRSARPRCCGASTWRCPRAGWSRSSARAAAARPPPERAGRSPDSGERGRPGPVGPGIFVAAERRRIGMVLQDAALFPHLSVGRNVAYGLPRRAPDRAARVADAPLPRRPVGLRGPVACDPVGRPAARRFLASRAGAAAVGDLVGRASPTSTRRAPSCGSRSAGC